MRAQRLNINGVSISIELRKQSKYRQSHKTGYFDVTLLYTLWRTTQFFIPGNFAQAY